MSARSRVVLGCLLPCLVLISPATPRAGLGRGPEVEPTVPLLLDVRFEEIDRSPAAVHARLVVDLAAAASIQDIELSLALPDGLQVAGSWPVPRALARLDRGERRHFVLPVSGPPDRDLPVRLEASYEGDDGRFRIGQGATLPGASSQVEGQLVAGAYEVPAVLLQDLHR